MEFFKIKMQEKREIFDIDCCECNHILNIHQHTDPTSAAISRQAGNLLLGGVDSFSQSIMTGYNITAVVSVLDLDTFKSYCIQKKLQRFNVQEHKWIDFEDDADANVLGKFEESHTFIKEKLQKHNVLVHCQMGVSRSATFVLAFLMKEFKLTF
jgi:dual specificity MAP kinase phosphatase